jgi:ABC-type lipoprotein release transport system permease subunit
MGQAALEYRDDAGAVLLQGVDPVAENGVMRLGKDVLEGDLIALVHANTGSCSATNLQKTWKSMCETGWMPFFRVQTTSFKVVGLIDTGTSADEVTAYTRLDAVQDFFNEPGVVSTIGVRVADPYQADAIASSIERENGLDAIRGVKQTLKSLAFWKPR